MEAMQHNHTHTDTCFDCAEACERCATACLEMHDSDSKGHDMTACIKLCRDCADICTLCGRLTARGSDFMKSFMKVCAEACEACAKECEKHADHMAHCKACAEACRKCADECRSMSAKRVRQMSEEVIVAFFGHNPNHYSKPVNQHNAYLIWFDILNQLAGGARTSY